MNALIRCMPQSLSKSPCHPWLVALFVICALCPLHAQPSVWQPTPGHTQIPLWPGPAPDPQATSGPERFVHDPGLIGGRPTSYIVNVTRPTLTVYPAQGRNTGAAVVVYPGGGYEILAIDLEGTEVCDWLTPRGITCVLLKYRVPDDNGYPKPAPYPKSGPYPESPLALEDAQRAMGLLRLHAPEWHIDPHKVGVLGFSAGGHLVAAISNHYDHRIYRPIDAADQQSCRPDFAISIYPGHLSLSAAEWDASLSRRKFVVPHAPNADRELSLNPDLHVTAQTPPTFLLQAEDDHEDNVDDALSYYIALKNAHVPAELHLYPQGGHAFGLRRTRLPITAWPQLVDTWLESLGILSR